jgi:hypothetical protein
MGKHETPAFRMKIERGRLIPVTAFDAERLDSYQNGSELRVSITQPKNDKLLRKYWAILGKVVADCPTPWNNKDQASEALKLSLGIVDYGKTVSDKFFQYPKSLTELDDPEFRAYYDDAMALLHKITGVDPEQLGAESPDVGEDEQNTSVDSPQDTDVPGEVEPSSLSQSNPADEADHGEGAELETSAGTAPDPVDESDHDFDEADWLKSFAKVIVAAIGPDEAVIVDVSKGQFVDGLSEDARARAKTIVNYARQACRGEIEPDDAKEIIAGKARMESVKELV